MKIIQVDKNNKDFVELCLLLENFQHQMLPTLKEKGYTLTDVEGITAFLLYDGEIAIGSIGIKQVDDKTCEIVRVYVRDECRGKGYAKLLFDHVEEYAREHGYVRAEMVTWAESTSALALYKKLGYTLSDVKISEWFKGLEYVELHKDLKSGSYIKATRTPHSY